jgi:rubredoxin
MTRWTRDALDAPHTQRHLDALPDAQTCRKCGGPMRPGLAMDQTCTSGAPDFPGADEVTMSPGGPGRLIQASKCSNCGWSVK